MWEWTYKISVNEIQWRGGLVSLPFIKLLWRMLDKDTSFTKPFIKVDIG
jgi:hypothetical protein